MDLGDIFITLYDSNCISGGCSSKWYISFCINEKCCINKFCVSNPSRRDNTLGLNDIEYLLSCPRLNPIILVKKLARDIEHSGVFDATLI